MHSRRRSCWSAAGSRANASSTAPSVTPSSTMSSIESERRLTAIGEVGVGNDALVTSDDSKCFVAGRRGEPRREAVGLADPAAVLGKSQPHGLDDVLGGGGREPERPGDGPHESGEALDQLVPRALVAVDDARQQRGLVGLTAAEPRAGG